MSRLTFTGGVRDVEAGETIWGRFGRGWIGGLRGKSADSSRSTTGGGATWGAMERSMIPDKEVEVTGVREGVVVGGVERVVLALGGKWAVVIGMKGLAVVLAF